MTSIFIKKLLDEVNAIVPTFYETASESEKFPFAVVSGINVNDLAHGDLVYFNIDVWGDSKSPNATATMETTCENIRKELTNKTLIVENEMYCHLGFENQNMIGDNEYDKCHRKVSFTARVFYTR